MFSGLDADTEEHVFQQVFGVNGLLRRRNSTVVICTHSIRHLPSADYIIALEDGIIREQGTFDHLSTSQGYIQRLELKSISDREPYEKPAPEKDASMLKSQLACANTANSDTIPLSPDAIALRQVGDATVYKHYFKSMGWFVAACSLFFAALWGFFTNYPSICKIYGPRLWNGNLISPICRAHILGRCRCLEQSFTFLRLLRRDLCVASDVRHDSTAPAGNHALHCFSQEGRSCSASRRITNLDSSTAFILYEDRYWCRNQLVFAGSKFDRHRATRCDFEHSVLCKLLVDGIVIFWLSDISL